MSMTKEQLEIIADALQSSIDNARKESDLFELNTERPAMVEYLRKELIPKLEKSYKILLIKYYTAKSE